MSGTYKKPFQTFNKSGQIKEAQERKNQMIRQYTDEKSLSIAVSSAFNNAAQYVITLVDIQEIKPEDFWNVHEEFYKEYLGRFLDKQELIKGEYAERMRKLNEIADKHVSDNTHDIVDFGETQEVPMPGQELLG